MSLIRHDPPCDAGDPPEDSQQDPVARRRGIYLLPNLFTTAGLFAGFYAIVAAMNDRFEAAAIAIFVAMVMDGIDGRVARLTNTQSDFGAEYDSLADMVSFGLAPALVMYVWSLGSMRDLGWGWGKVGWLSCFIYAVAAALRLARFNTRGGSSQTHFFQGLPSPSAAAVMAGLVWVGTDLGYSGEQFLWPALALTLSAGLLMVSNLRYYSIKHLDLRGRVPFVAMLAAVGILVFTSIDPPKILFLFFITYLLSGPVWWAWRRRRRASQTASGVWTRK